MREQIARIEVPVTDITRDPKPRLVEDLGSVEILNQRARIMTTGRHLEVWVGRRVFEVNLEDLAVTATTAIAAHLKREVVEAVRSKAEVRARFGVEDDGFETLHPAIRFVEPMP